MAGLTSDGGISFIRSVDDRLGLTASLAPLLPDPRDPRYVTHTALDLLRQRVYSIIAGYEDLNDAQRLRGDPALKLAVGRDALDPDADLGSPATLRRFEHWITPQALALAEMTLFEEWRDHRPTPERLILDADSTWDETHGAQQLTFFNAHYDSYGYHPILVFDGETGDLIVAHLRPGNVGAAEGIVAWLEGLVEGIRAKWPDVPILFRADAGFATPSVYEWCEANGVDYLIGLGINKRLAVLSAANLEAAKAEYLSGKVPAGEQAKAFTEFEYKAGSWKTHRRVIAKAEYGPLGSNQRYVVTSLKNRTPRQIYTYCGRRGESENWIKNLKNALAADRLSCKDFLPTPSGCCSTWSPTGSVRRLPGSSRGSSASAGNSTPCAFA